MLSAWAARCWSGSAVYRERLGGRALLNIWSEELDPVRTTEPPGLGAQLTSYVRATNRSPDASKEERPARALFQYQSIYRQR